MCSVINISPATHWQISIFSTEQQAGFIAQISTTFFSKDCLICFTAVLYIQFPYSGSFCSAALGPGNIHLSQLLLNWHFTGNYLYKNTHSSIAGERYVCVIHTDTSIAGAWVSHQIENNDTTSYVPSKSISYWCPRITPKANLLKAHIWGPTPFVAFALPSALSRILRYERNRRLDPCEQDPSTWIPYFMPFTIRAKTFSKQRLLSYSDNGQISSHLSYNWTDLKSKV